MSTRWFIAVTILAPCGVASVGAVILDPPATAWPPDVDECIGGDGDGACALNAMQLRGRRMESVTGCDADAIGRMVQALSPACATRCPDLCSAALPSVAAVQVAGGAASGVCAGRVHVACALEDANAEACAPVLLEMQVWLGETSPKTVSDLEAMCTREVPANSDPSLIQADISVERGLAQRAAAGVAVLGEAARAEMMDAVLAGKTPEEACEKGREGQTCVSNNQWVYCSNHKRLSAGVTNCETRGGHLSLCRQDGFGLAHDYCDDPFCRAGGAHNGAGNYCHNDKIVFCQGLEPPRVVNECPDRTWTDYNGNKHTETGHCGGDYPHPYCSYQDDYSVYPP